MNDIRKQILNGNIKRAACGGDASFYALSDAFSEANVDARVAVNIKKQKHLKLTPEEIITATQFFTPKEICEYLVYNALSALIGEDFNNNPYYDKNSCHSNNKPRKNISELKIIDPAAGSGNLLFAAAKAIIDYSVKRGVSREEAGKLASKSIVGLELDKRAAEFASVKLSAYCGAQINVYAIEVLSDNAVDYIGHFGGADLSLSAKNITVSGSLAKINVEELNNLETVVSASRDVPYGVKEFMRIARILSDKYDLVLINPPYLSFSDYGKDLKEYIYSEYKEYHADLFAAFIKKAAEMTAKDGCFGVVAPYNWMFLKQFTALRELITDNYTVLNLAKLALSGYRSAVVYLSAFVARGSLTGEDGSFIELADYADTEKALALAASNSCAHKYTVNQSVFKSFPVNGFAFWLSPKMIANFGKEKLSDYLDIRQGLATGNNKKYLKKLKKVKPADVDFSAESLDDFIKNGKKYALYNKGGEFKKWFGNREYVLLFDKKARAELSVSGNRLPSKKYYFKRGVTWTLVSSKGIFGARLTDNSVFDVGGSCGFPKDPDDLYPILAYLCSKVATLYLNALNPTVNCQVGDLKNLPYINPQEELKKEITELAKACVDTAKADWYEFESGAVPTDSVQLDRAASVLSAEERLNEIFIELYGLKGEVSPEVEFKNITLAYKLPRS